jgi:hypothetical protein
MALVAIPAGISQGQIVDENFDGVTETGGIEILTGSGYNEVSNWDDGLDGDKAFAGTFGDGAITSAFAQGDAAAGVGGSGAGVLSVSGASFADGGWFAGLFFPDLEILNPNPAALILQADILGSVPGASYVLRLEGISFSPFGLDEDFSDVLGGPGVVFFDNTSGPTGFTDNWDDGIGGEVAFAGIVGGGVVVGNVMAAGLPSGGLDGGGAELVVDNIIPDPGGRWYAGLAWPGQTLPTDDLSQVSLTADVKGEINGGTLGDYILRLEDQDLDFLYFDVVSDGTFQSVGGPLSTATEGGFGDGVFDTERGPFSAVVVFNNDISDTWGQGGRLTVDNVFLSGGETRSVVGSVQFTGVADGTTFETVGGAISTGDSTFTNVNESFGDVTETGGGVFFDNTSGVDGFTPNWDDGVQGEQAFAGFFGLVSVVGGASAQGLASGGASGGGGGELEVSDLTIIGSCDTSGWYAGLSWPDQIMPSTDLSEVVLTADVKGEMAPGQSLGFVTLRLEDADQDQLSFFFPANSTFQTIGGPLSSATEGTGQLPSSDGIFDSTRGPFTVVVGFDQPCQTWGTGGKITVDNVFLTAAPFGAGVDNYAIVVAMEGNPDNSEWGSDGSLIVDNLSLSQSEVSCEPVMADDRFDIIGNIKACETDADCGEGVVGPDPQTVCRDGSCYVARQRYLSLKPNPANEGLDRAIRVSLDTGVAGGTVLGFVQAPQNTLTVGPGPSLFHKASIGSEPFYLNWNSLTAGYVTVGDCEVSPGNAYLVQCIALGDDIGEESNYSLPLQLMTPADNGDVTGGGNPGQPPNGAVGTLVDVFSVIKGFQNTQNEPKDWLDFTPTTGTAEPNLVVGLDDAFGVILAFQQNPYGGPAPLDCP